MSQDRLGPFLCGLDERECRRLTPRAIRSFRDIARRWNLSTRDGMKLVGVRPSDVDRYHAMLANSNNLPLSPSALRRIAFLAGIRHELDRLYPASIADDWVNLPNARGMFRGQPPLAFLRMGLSAQRGVLTLLRRAGDIAPGRESSEISSEFSDESP